MPMSFFYMLELADVYLDHVRLEPRLVVFVLLRIQTYWTDIFDTDYEAQERREGD